MLLPGRNQAALATYSLKTIAYGLFVAACTRKLFQDAVYAAAAAAAAAAASAAMLMLYK
jgi:hypothetical protein